MSEITEERLRAMKIGESFGLGECWAMLVRVPNGWVYDRTRTPGAVCFVPDGSLAGIEDRLIEIRDSTILRG